MEKVLVVLCILALSVTAVDGYTEFSGEDPFGFTTDDVEDNGDMSTIETVVVPEKKLREIVHYDLTMRIEFYDENKTSGEWMLWILDVSGQELIKTPGAVRKADGFSEEHATLYQRRDLSAQFTIFADSSDGEAITSDGEFDVQRNEYTDLHQDEDEQKLIVTESNANLSVDQLQTTTVPLSFEGFMRSYYNPHEERHETLDEQIYGGGRTIELGDEGDIVEDTDFYPITYNWKAERGEIIAEYETIKINITTDFGSENFSIPFKEEVWISNEVSAPVKQFIRTNTSWDWEEGYGYFVLETTFTLRDKGFTAGTSSIPWGDCTGYHWLNQHPWAETEFWDGNYMPKSGSDFEDSSFDFRTEELVGYLEAEEPSEDLKQFLADYPNAIISGATYNASKDSTDPDGKKGEYWWNVTFGHKKGDDEPGSSWNYKYQYQVLVYQETDFEWVTDPTPQKVYTNTFRLEKDFGVISGAGPLSADDISSQTVTLASSEKIFKTDSKVMENFYTTPGGISLEELDWGEGDGTRYSMGASDWEQSGMDLVATLTGIQTVTFEKYFWYLEKDDLMAGGTYSSATLDAESGRIINVMELDGTALQDAMKLGD